MLAYHRSHPSFDSPFDSTTRGDWTIPSPLGQQSPCVYNTVMITQLLDQSILDVRGATLFVDRGTKVSRICCVPEMGLTVYRISVRSKPPAYRGFLDILRLSNGHLRITLSTIISTELHQARPEVYPPHLVGETTTTFPTIEEAVCHAKIFWIRLFKTQGWTIEGVEASFHPP